jgi:pimeloyl-ACP methyl ester carboxylesterase
MLNHHRGGTGEPLVLIHGIGSRWQIWDPVLPLLEPSREVIALDLPGFGASPMSDRPGPPGVEYLADSVCEFLDECSLERPHVAGNSLGGWLSLELARRGRAQSATALSPAGFWSEGEGLRSRLSLFLAVRSARLTAKYADTLLASPLRRKIALWQFSAHPEKIPPQDAADSIRALARAPSFDATLAAMLGQRFSHGEQLDVPVTIAWGERDRLLPPRQALWAKHLIPNARSVILWGCGHVPTYDDPEQIAQVLLEGSGTA